MQSVCCFCADTIDSDDDQSFAVSVQRQGSDASQGWYAHEACLKRCLHPGAMFSPESLD